MNLNEIINQKVNDILDEKLEAIVSKHIESSIDYMFRDMFASWGSQSKQIQKQLEDSLQINLEKAKLETYNQRVIKVVYSVLEKHLDTTVVQCLTEQIESSFSYITQREWKMSEIVNLFAKTHHDKSDGEDFEPTIIVRKSNYGSIHICLDEESEKKWYDGQYTFSINEKGKVYHAGMRGGTAMVPSGKFEQTLFALHANQCTVEIDEYETVFYCEE